MFAMINASSKMHAVLIKRVPVRHADLRTVRVHLMLLRNANEQRMNECLVLTCAASHWGFAGTCVITAWQTGIIKQILSVESPPPCSDTP